MKFNLEELNAKAGTKYDKNCELNANWFSKMTFYWSGDILKKGGALEKQGKYIQSKRYFFDLELQRLRTRLTFNLGDQNLVDFELFFCC